MKIKNENMDVIVHQISSRPTDMLALGRTLMSSQRSLLSFVSTSVGFLAGGIGIIMYLSSPLIIVLGCTLVAASVLILIVGYRNYREMQLLLNRAYEAMKSSSEVEAEQPAGKCLLS